jgi:DNA-binding SARP family transcriptional activator
MAQLRVHLFGRFQGRRGDRDLSGLNAAKAQELLCYLLLHKGRSLTREALSAFLWSDTPTAQSKKYLRQALWHLSSALNSDAASGMTEVLVAGPEWVNINPEAEIWVDVAEFEGAFASAQGVPGRDLDDGTAQALEGAVQLYRGDLLEGWYQDWCLFERERLQNMLLGIVDKLMVYCAARGDCDRGISYGTRALSFDSAREQTHRRLMRLYYQEGNRTGALRQYENCVRALDRELGVGPAARTVSLYEQIRADQLAAIPPAQAEAVDKAGSPDTLPDILTYLKRISGTLADLQRLITKDIKAAEILLRGRR